MKLCIAGKNNIAVDCLYYAMTILDKKEICVILNETDQKKNTWQKSLAFAARKEKIEIKLIKDVQNIKNIVFLSLEYDKIIRPELFKTRKLYNIHFSLLPEYKGMYTSLLPILHGKIYSGVTLHYIDKGIDTGDIIDQAKINIENLTCKNLYFKYIEEGTKLVCANMKELLFDTVRGIPQSSRNSTYFSKTSFDFKNKEIHSCQTAYQIQQFINSMNFRVYQLPVFKKFEIYKAEILEVKSTKKQGCILFEDLEKFEISTIDYNVNLYKDYFNELIGYCKTNNLDAAKRIIHLVPNLEEFESNGWNPLIIASYYGSDKIVNLLLERGVNPNLTNLNGTTPLMYAKDAFLKNRNFRIIKLLIENGANIKAIDIYKKNIFDYTDDIELISFLKKT